MATRESTPLSHLVAAFRHSNEAANLSPRTVRWYDELLRAFLRWLEEQGVGPVLGNFTLEQVEEYVRHLRQRINQHNGRKLSTHTVHAHVRVLKVFAGYLRHRGFTEGNVLEGLRYPKVRPPEIEALSEEENLRVLAAAATGRASGFRNLCIVATFLDTGLRCSELATLRYEDAHLEEGCLEVTGKGDRPRPVPVSPKVRGLLMRYRDRYRPQTPPYPDEPFFLSEGGGALTPNALALMVRRLAKRANVPRLHPHLFRHSFATGWLRNGGDMETLRRILGHVDYRMVQRYLHLVEDDILLHHYVCSPMERLLTLPRRGVPPIPRGRPRGSPAPAANTRGAPVTGAYAIAPLASKGIPRRGSSRAPQPTAHRRTRRALGRSLA